MHASQIQGCIVEQRAKKKRKIAESVWVHNVVTVRTGKVAGWPVCNALYTNVASLKCARHSMGSQWRFWSNAVDESGEVYGR